MCEKIKSVNQLLEEAVEEFKKEFSEDPLVRAVAPGRVNLIGGHTDYNAGFVLPMALPMTTVMVGKFNGTDHCNIITLSNELKEENRVEFKITDSPIPRSPHKWVNYIIGVLEYFPCANKRGFNAIVNSSVPLGAGLSSSAALEVSTFTLLEGLYKIRNINLVVKALLCQKSEHKYADTPCGIMDQLVSVTAKKNYFVLIDCKDYSTELIEMKNKDLAILIINSNVKHDLGSSEYPLRREHCHNAAKKLNVKTLRCIGTEDLEEAKSKLDPTEYKRAKHAVSESERVLDAVVALSNNNMDRLGQLISQSHASLKDDFEVSCSEVDNIVEIVQSCSGVYGCRMTGGGFGGCVVALVNNTSVDNVIKKVQESYSGKATFYLCQSEDGAHLL